MIDNLNKSIMSVVKPATKGVWKLTSKAEEVWKGLNGIIAVYKPAGNTANQVRKTLILHLCRDLNGLEVRPCSPYVCIEGETNEPMKVTVRPSYADHELVVGPRYQECDFKAFAIDSLTKDMSGIMIFGINRGAGMASIMKRSNPTKFYRLKGILGQATDNYFINGKIVEKSTFGFIKRHHIDMVCAATQAAHQRKMFELCGLDIQSQAAYELAVQGPVRPAENRIPMMYSLRCIDFKPPEFTLEVVCLNEDEMFLKNLIHGIGLQLRSTATCTLMQCLQWGIFNLDIALLKRDWTLGGMVNNMNRIRVMLGKNKFLFNQEDPIFREYMSNSN